MRNGSTRRCAELAERIVGGEKGGGRSCERDFVCRSMKALQFVNEVGSKHCFLNSVGMIVESLSEGFLSGWIKGRGGECIYLRYKLSIF